MVLCALHSCCPPKESPKHLCPQELETIRKIVQEAATGPKREQGQQGAAGPAAAAAGAAGAAAGAADGGLQGQGQGAVGGGGPMPTIKGGSKKAPCDAVM